MISRRPGSGHADQPGRKLITDIENADDNNEVVALQGNFADPWDAGEDARTFGREYCLRQWIVSPSREVTFEKMLEAVDRLASIILQFGVTVSESPMRCTGMPSSTFKCRCRSS